MIKFVAIVLLVALACRWIFGRWPWDYLRAPDSRARERIRAERMLGVSHSASADDIREAHRRMAASLHPDRGGSDARLAEINAARDLLLQDTSHQGQTDRL
ncbi:J domain-containing protein [Qipengyuania spongiae]|uniref:J domain-containing protein n=1 Tax=Qipengyuania spongiae TaxID=2909673 RepID=A0ABY5SZX5_9SPHN|nr:J domain-containing protein [Qipengyuania spongiae]UVI40092.1 J domain-containing protein [Qipengyuania spongiae]